MGIYDRDYYQEHTPALQVGMPRSANARLILITVLIHIVMLIVGPYQAFFALHGEDLVRPWYWWRLLSYGFLHDRTSVAHLVFNMFALFIFGRDVEGIYGPIKYLRFYLTAIIVSGLTWLLLAQSLPGRNMLIGASGAVTAVTLLFVLHYPRRTIYFNFLVPIPAWLLGVLIVGVNVFGVRSNEGGVAYDVHLAGAAYAWLFKQTQWDLLSWSWPSGWRLASLARRPSLKIHEPPRASDHLAEQADAILEKLHRHGEASLTDRERRILEEYSRSVRDRRR